MSSEVAELKKLVESLSNEVTRLRGNYSSWLDLCKLLIDFIDEQDIKKLHFKYGYYLDKCLYQEVR